MDRITLSSMRYECLIGAGEEERSFPQMLEIDLVVEADLSAAAASDALADTIDYGPLVTLVERIDRGRLVHDPRGPGRYARAWRARGRTQSGRCDGAGAQAGGAHGRLHGSCPGGDPARALTGGTLA